MEAALVLTQVVPAQMGGMEGFAEVGAEEGACTFERSGAVVLVGLEGAEEGAEKGCHQLAMVVMGVMVGEEGELIPALLGTASTEVSPASFL